MISNAADFLDVKLGYSPGTIRNHMQGWVRIRKFMTLKGIKCYSDSEACFIDSSF